MKISIDGIDPNPRQPRHHFAGLEELAASIDAKGLLQPIMVRPQGERRWRACKLIGLTELTRSLSE